jgi:hypothetical protein
MNVKETYQRAAKLKEEIEANERKRGNAERRVEYAALMERIDRWGRVRASIRAKSLFHVSGPRPDSQITYSRDSIARYSSALLIRGEYNELLVQTLYKHDSRRTPRPIIPAHALHHPKLATVRDVLAAWRLVDRCDELPTPGARWDKKGRGVAVNHDLYGFVPGLALVQVRRFERDKYTNVTLRYFVTDGVDAIEISNGKKSLIKRAASLDPAPASPLRALRNQLPPNWQSLIDGDAPKFPAPPKGETRTTYKIVRLAGFGLMVSLYDGSTIYAIDKRMTQRVGKHAGSNLGFDAQRHDGGWYSHPSPERCLELQRKHMLAANDDNERATYVLLECEISGRIVEFDNGKIASTRLTPRRILATYTLDTMPESITA